MGANTVTILESEYDELVSRNVSLRDYFAAAAIPECINTEPRSWKEKIKAFLGYDYIGARPSAQGIAKDAYAIADAMLAQRNKKNV